MQSFNSTAGSTYTASLDIGYLGIGISSFDIRFSILDAANLNQAFRSLEVSNSFITFPTTPWTFATCSFQFAAPSTNIFFRVEDINISR